MLKIFKTAFDAWNKFWFKKELTYSLGILRITTGFFVFLLIAMSFPNWQKFYGPNGVVPFSVFRDSWTTDAWLAASSWSVFILSDSELYVWAIFWIGIAASIFFITGFRSRLAAIVLFVVVMSMFHRNYFIINGHDRVVAMFLFFSLFAPLGESFSLDEFLRRLKHYKSLGKDLASRAKPIWSTRLLQLSFISIYFFSGPSKFVDDITWRDGSAMYYISLSDRWFRFPNVDLFHNAALSIPLTFSALALEISFPFLIWFSRTRPFMLVGAFLMHSFIMIFFSPNVFLFNLIMLPPLILFIKPETVKSFLDRIWPKRTANVFYDGQCTFCIRVINILRVLDIRERIKFFDLRSPEVYKNFPEFNIDDLSKEMYLKSGSGAVYKGFFSFRHLTHAVPALYPLMLLFYFPGASFFGPKIYNYIAQNRFRFSSCGCDLSGGNHVCGIK